AEMGSSKFRRRSKAEFLNFVRIREWQELVGHLRSLLGSAGIRIDKSVWRPNTEPDQELSSPETVRRERSGRDHSTGTAHSTGRGHAAGAGHSAGAGQSAGNRSGSGKIGFAELSAADRRAKKQGASAPAGAGQQVSAV